MGKKTLLSMNLQHDVMKEVVKKLKTIKQLDFVFHDPTTDFLDLEDLSNYFRDINFLIVKVGSEGSIDLLHYAKLHDIPSLHDVDTVLMCKNKVSLDHALRKVLNTHSRDLSSFVMPRSWTQSILNVEKFKEWAEPRLPIVIKSHYQHDKHMRFNFLVREIEEVDIFCEKFREFLSYDVYVQEFIPCDGIDRKIYVIGEQIFGIKRENPIYIFLRENPEDIDTDMIKRKEFLVPESIRKLARVLSRELKLKIFGFDLLKLKDQELFYLIDLNDFPGFRGINDIENVLAKYLENLILNK